MLFPFGFSVHRYCLDLTASPLGSVSTITVQPHNLPFGFSVHHYCPTSQPPIWVQCPPLLSRPHSLSFGFSVHCYCPTSQPPIWVQCVPLLSRPHCLSFGFTVHHSCPDLTASPLGSVSTVTVQTSLPLLWVQCAPCVGKYFNVVIHTFYVRFDRTWNPLVLVWAVFTQTFILGSFTTVGSAVSPRWWVWSQGGWCIFRARSQPEPSKTFWKPYSHHG